MKAQLHPKKSRGFALIATISVLLLLTLIAVAFLSLSAVSVRTARIDMAEEEARSNARLALMIALGELQREMGPDQRVSASAAILDNSVETYKITGIEEPHWLGVWSTNWGESSTGETGGAKDPDTLTPWTRNAAQGGLRDRRFTESWDRETAVSTYLVSGNEGGQERIRDAGRQLLKPDKRLTEKDGGKIIKLVGPGSVNDDDDMVDVKTVNINREMRRPNGAIQQTAMGNYAFWITDESAKARISLVDRHQDESPSADDQTGFQRVFHAQDVEAGAMEGWTAIPEAANEKLISLRSAELAGVDPEAVRDTFHDATTSSRTVLVNARDGGLQKDLAIPLVEGESVPDLESGRLEYIGLTLGDDEVADDDTISGDLLVGPPNEKIANLTGHEFDSRLHAISPRFRIMSNWLEAAKDNSFAVTGNKLDLTGDQRPLLPYPVNYGSPRTGGSNTWDGFLADPAGNGPSSSSEDVHAVPFTKLDRSTVAPVVVEAGFYYNIAARRGGSTSAPSYRLYVALYPRVALWNPYNVEMTVPAMLCEMYINGNKDVNIEFAGDPTRRVVNLGFGKGRGPQDGDLWFIIADDVNSNQNPKPLVIGPGETIVCTPDLNRSKRQGGLRGNYSIGGDTLNNLLTPYNAESANNYLLDELSLPWTENDRTPFKPISFFEEGSSAGSSGGDNFKFVIKDASSYRRVLAPECQRAPMMIAGNISLQAGGGDEDPLVWDSKSPVPVYEFQNNVAGRPLVAVGGTADPDKRTRDGFRLRWFEENPGNLDSTNALSGGDMDKLFQTAMLGNWNIRASHIMRTPWDNTSDEAPYFFGNYTRDKPDDAIAWENTKSQKVGSRYTGFPFGSPTSQYNAGPVVLFELPSEEFGIPNLAYLRNMKLSELAWHPTYAIGNSLADPRCQQIGTVVDLDAMANKSQNGWNAQTMGSNYWSRLFRELLFYQTDKNHVAFDMSYEVNYNLWDTYLISSGGPTKTRRDRQMDRFSENPSKDPLPNGRYGLFNRPDLETSVTEDLSDFFRVAARLSLEGGFNVNSTSVDAWRALIASTLGVSVGDSKGVIFPRFLNPSGSTTQDSGITADSLTGNRDLSEKEVESLAEQMVTEVKKRGPFFGLSDFVNRRLVDDLELSRAGPIETALRNAGINSSFESGSLAITGREEDIGDARLRSQQGSIGDSTQLDHRLKPASKAWGLPGYLTQGDVLGVIGSSLTARGDTFKIRTYGESRDVNGKILARAWCEATVQRTPEPVNPDKYGINPKPVGEDGIDFGRRFRIVGFRWLDQAEV